MSDPERRAAISKPIMAAIAAGFIAIMLAGPGMMIPGHFRSWSPLVCKTLGADMQPEVVTFQRQDYRGRSTGFEFYCVDPAGGRIDVAGRAMLIAFCVYFLLLFIAVSLGLRNVDMSVKPPGRRRS